MISCCHIRCSVVELLCYQRDRCIYIYMLRRNCSTLLYWINYLARQKSQAMRWSREKRLRLRNKIASKGVIVFHSHNKYMVRDNSAYNQSTTLKWCFALSLSRSGKRSSSSSLSSQKDDKKRQDWQPTVATANMDHMHTCWLSISLDWILFQRSCVSLTHSLNSIHWLGTFTIPTLSNCGTHIIVKRMIMNNSIHSLQHGTELRLRTLWSSISWEFDLSIINNGHFMGTIWEMIESDREAI